jgi:hypothetical protein
MRWVEVSKEEFYRNMGPLNVHPSPNRLMQDKWVEAWKNPASGQVYGKTETDYASIDENGHGTIKHFLPGA